MACPSDDELVPGRGDDYELDQDPLAYMTTDYPSPYLIESRINMSRRMLWRWLHALPPSWPRRRRVFGLAFAGIVLLMMVVIGISELVRHI